MKMNPAAAVLENAILGRWWLLCVYKHLNFKGGFIFFIIETFSTFSSVTFYAQVCRWSILSLLPLIYDNTKRCSKMHCSMLHYMTNTENLIILVNNAAYTKYQCIPLMCSKYLYFDMMFWDTTQVRIWYSYLHSDKILWYIATKYLFMSPHQRIEF